MDDMAKEFTLPELPPLMSPTDFQRWVAALVQTLRFYGLADYIFRDSADLVKSARNKAFVMVLMTTSATWIMAMVGRAGWNAYKIDQDPKDLFDLIEKVVAREYFYDHIEDDLKCLRGTYYDTLSEFQAEARRMKRRMGKGYKDDITWGDVVVVEALMKRREVWYHSLKAELTAGRLTWDRLMDKIEKKAQHEQAESEREERGRKRKCETSDSETSDSETSDSE
jgi:hypothetical protein